MRSRSVFLGVQAEASDLPAFPVRWGDEEDDGNGEGSSIETLIRYDTVGTRARRLFRGLNNNPALEVALAEVKLQQEVDEGQREGVSETEEFDDYYDDYDYNYNNQKEKQDEKEREEPCKKCHSIRRALLKNPACCIERPKAGKACRKCWRGFLADRLRQEKKKEDWMCCVVCGRKLLMEDVRRLGGRGMVVR